MVAISEAESHCREDAIGDTTLTFEQDGRTYGFSVGPLQIRMLPGREWIETSNYYEAAHIIWQNQGYHSWSTYTNGSYLQYL